MCKVCARCVFSNITPDNSPDEMLAEVQRLREIAGQLQRGTMQHVAAIHTSMTLEDEARAKLRRIAEGTRALT